VSPSSGSAGVQVTVSGSGFGSAQGTGTVLLGSRPGAVVSWSNTQIVATVASNATSGNVQVQQGGAWSNAVPFSVSTAAISSVTPSSGVPGTVVTIAGSGFGAAQGSGQVWLGTVPGVVQSWSDAQVVAVVATGAATGNASVLQNGVISNAVPFTVNSLQLTSVSPNSGVAGTSVTLTGAGFGASQGTGIAWLGSMAGQVVSWSDTQIVAAVATGALTGIARVQQNGVWCNAAAFAVPGSDGTTMSLVPNPINLEVGDTQMIQALSGAGQPVTGLTWTSSDPTVVSLSTDDPPVLTAVAAGQVTITAGTATANVTVWATTPPVGTVLWSNPGDGSGVTSIVPAVLSGYGVAHVFALQGDGTVQAITGYGTTAWTAVVSRMGTAALSSMRRAALPRVKRAGRYSKPAYQDQQGAVVLPDFRGGLVMAANNSIVGLDGMTGQPTFTPSSGGLGPLPYDPWNPQMAVHPDGTIFALQGDTNGNVSVVGIDPTAGALKFTVAVFTLDPSLPLATNGPIIAGDGYAYMPYARSHNFQPPGCTAYSRIGLLRIDSSGNYNDIDVMDFAAPCWGGDILEVPINIITNFDQGTLLTFVGFDFNDYVATTAGTSVSVTSVPLGAAGVPVLQAQDGSFIGTVGSDSYDYNLVAFDASGNVLWMAPGNWQPQIANRRRRRDRHRPGHRGSHKVRPERKCQVATAEQRSGQRMG
jgi:hypothetical protein